MIVFSRCDKFTHDRCNNEAVAYRQVRRKLNAWVRLEYDVYLKPCGKLGAGIPSSGL